MDGTDEADTPRVVHHRDRLIGIGQEVFEDGVRKRHCAEEVEQRRPGRRAAQQDGLLAGIEQGQPDMALAIDLDIENAAGMVVLGGGSAATPACAARAMAGLRAVPEAARVSPPAPSTSAPRLCVFTDDIDCVSMRDIWSVLVPDTLPASRKNRNEINVLHGWHG